MRRIFALFVCLSVTLFAQPVLARCVPSRLTIFCVSTVSAIRELVPTASGSSTSSARSTWKRTRSSATSGSLRPMEPRRPEQLTRSDKGDRRPRWSPDGKLILFESSRSDGTQLWIISSVGGEPRQLTKLSTGATTGTWSRDGKRIAFVSTVWPEYSARPFAESDVLNKKRQEEQENNPVKARVHTRLFYRHWDDYVNDKRQHLFVVNFDHGQAGEPRDLTPGDRDADPTSSTFSSGDDFTFSPDGKHLLFTAVPEKNEAWTTNYDIGRVPVEGGKVECLTFGQSRGGFRTAVFARRQMARLSRPASAEQRSRSLGAYAASHGKGWHGHAAEPVRQVRRLGRFLRVDARFAGHSFLGGRGREKLLLRRFSKGQRRLDPAQHVSEPAFESRFNHQ